MNEARSDLQSELARHREAESLTAAPDARVVALAGTEGARGARGRLVYEACGGETSCSTTYDLRRAAGKPTNSG